MDSRKKTDSPSRRIPDKNKESGVTVMLNVRSDVLRACGAHALIAVALLLVFLLGHNALSGPLFVKTREMPSKSNPPEALKFAKSPTQSHGSSL